MTGTKNANSSGTTATADRAEVVTTPLFTINDNTVGASPNSFSYAGTWSYATGSPEKYQGDDHYSDSAGSTAQIVVSGTRIALYGSRAPWHGIATVSVDSEPPMTVDYYAPSRRDGAVVYVSPDLPPGDHTLTVTVTGTKNTAASGVTVTVDRVAMRP